MTDDRDPPLYDALRALSGLTARHQLREEPAMSDEYLRGEYARASDFAGYTDVSPDPQHYGLPVGHRYGSDDTPGGPPEPPLGEEHHPSPMGFAIHAPTGPGPELVACPTCGGGVTPDRLGR